MPAVRAAAAAILLATAAGAATHQFRGVNWADKRDNFQSGVLYLSGLSSTDTYASASTVAERVIGQFMSKLGSNSVRMPVNEATVGRFWGTYTGAIDVALSKGRVILCYWGSASGANPPDMNAWWSMWSTVLAKYGSNRNLYVEVFNEPSGYAKADLLNLYDQWLKRFPDFPRGRILLDGSGLAWGVPDVGSDRRFDSCLLAVHDYTFFAGSDMVAESQWANHIKGYVGAYSDRTVATEWGGPMTTGSKNGVTYQPMDYTKPATNFFEAYIRGISQQLRDWKMGSFYWPGLRDGDWYSITNRTGSGASIELTVPNPSGLTRLRYSWADTLPTAIGTSARDGGSEPRAEIVGSALEVAFTPLRDGTASIRLVDLDGRIRTGTGIRAAAGRPCRVSFEVASLPGGLYVLDLALDGRPAGKLKVVLNR